jgi:hypothetical protein
MEQARAKISPLTGRIFGVGGMLTRAANEEVWGEPSSAQLLNRVHTEQGGPSTALL